MLRYKNKRSRLRLLKHHLPLFVVSAVSIALLYFTRPYSDILTRASFATAYPALVLLAVTLLVGPWNLLRRQPNPLSSDLRRDLGIWAGLLCVLHSAIGQCVHMRGRPWLYYIYDLKERHSFPLRHDLFGVANEAGALSMLVLLALLITSNDYSMRTLGGVRWKRIQRWNYAAFAFAILHTIAYFIMEKQFTPFVMMGILCLFTTLSMQIVGNMQRRARQKRLNS